MTLFDDSDRLVIRVDPQPLEEIKRRYGVDEAKARRDRGMERAETNVDPDWTTSTEALLESYLRTHREFFVDDFWRDTELAPPAVGTSRALGPIVQRAARKGWIVKSGQARPSVRSNMQLKPVWTSRVYASPLEAQR